MRRSPVASRPPADFRRVYANDYYELWRRDRAVRVLDHLPLGRLYYRDRDAELLRRPRARASAPVRDGGELVAAPRPEVPTMGVAIPAGRPVGWVPDAEHAAAWSICARRAGSSARSARGRPAATACGCSSPAAGRWRCGSTAARSAARTRSTARSSGSRRASCDSAPGCTGSSSSARGGRPLPGDGYNGVLGPLALEPVRGGRVARARRAPRREAAVRAAAGTGSRRSGGERSRHGRDPRARTGAGCSARCSTPCAGSGSTGPSSCSWPTRARATAPASWPGAAARPCSPSSASRTAAPATG